jgi:hypothetical protein
MGITERRSAMKLKRDTVIGITLIVIAFIILAICKTRIIDSTYLTFDILRSRKGTVIVEKCIGTVTDFDKNGELFNGDPEYNYISYRGVRNAKVNDIFITYFVYNPFNNIEDDILLRFDFKL